MTISSEGIFSENKGGCPIYETVRNNPSYKDIRNECIRLWEGYKNVAESQYSKKFAVDFHGIFWEMYLFELLKGRCEIKPSGPDFYVDKSVLLEATVASIGGEDKNLPMSIPYDEQSIDTPYMTNCDRVISRITGAFIEKAGSNNEVKDESSNGIYTLGKEKPVVIAINLPYKEANDCDLGNGLGVRALYGLAQNSFFVTEELEFQPVLSNHPRIKKTDRINIPTTGFRNEENAHVAGVIIASVTPFSSTYGSPAFEFIHNPYALHPVSKGWFGIGSEYWIEEDKLLSSHY